MASPNMGGTFGALLGGGGALAALIYLPLGLEGYQLTWYGMLKYIAIGGALGGVFGNSLWAITTRETE
jgi:hypothetical protein